MSKKEIKTIKPIVNKPINEQASTQKSFTTTHLEDKVTPKVGSGSKKDNK